MFVWSFIILSVFHQATFAENKSRNFPARVILLPLDVSFQVQKNLALSLYPLMYVELKRSNNV